MGPRASLIQPVMWSVGDEKEESSPTHAALREDAADVHGASQDVVALAEESLAPGRGQSRPGGSGLGLGRLSPRRTSGAKLGAQRRRVQDLEPGDAYAIVQAQLEEPMAKELDQAYTTFAGLYNQRLSENDEAWLEQLGASGAPPRHLVIQHMARLARPFLQMQLERSLANFLAPWMADQTQDHLYLPSVRIMLPLLGDDGRRQFQLWYTSYMAGSTVQPPPLHEDHDDEPMEPPEPASGSAGP
eukprot:s4314_g4.t1